MKFDKNIKAKIEKIGQEYFYTKDERKKRRLEEDIVRVAGPYAAAYGCRRRPKDIEEDIQQESHIAVVKAIRTYNPQIAAAAGSSLYTWITWHIVQALDKEKVTSWIKVPLYIREIVNKYRRLLERNQAITDEEAIAELGCTEQVFSRVKETIIFNKSDLEILKNKKYEDFTDPADIRIDFGNLAENLSSTELYAIVSFYVHEKSIAEISRDINATPDRTKKLIEQGRLLIAEGLSDYDE